MGESEKYCLRWNDFQENISTAFRELRHDADFFDVTIACNSGLDISKTHKVKAHKVILSSCSTFFKDLLKSLNTPVTSQPMLYLRGIKFEDLQAILDFMYYGEVNIAQEKLNSFLAVAEELRVKGLSQSETGQQSSALKDASMFSAKKPKLVKRPAREDGNALSEVKNETSTSSKVPRFSSDGASSSQYPSGFGDDDFEVNERSLDAYSGNEDYADALNESAPDDAGVDSNKVWRDLQMIQLESGYWRCSLCNQEVQYRHSLQRHIESKHMKCEPIPCPYCEKSFNTKNSIQTHISKYHRNIQKLTL